MNSSLTSLRIPWVGLARGPAGEVVFNPDEEVQARIALELNEPSIGKVEEVLVEDTNYSHGRLQWKGRNRTNKWVFFPQPGEDGDGTPASDFPQASRSIQPGDLVKVRIERATAWSLQGCAVAL